LCFKKYQNLSKYFKLSQNLSSKSLKLYQNISKSIKTHIIPQKLWPEKKISKFIKIYQKLLKSIKIAQTISNSIKMYQHMSKQLKHAQSHKICNRKKHKIFQNLSTSLDIYQHILTYLKMKKNQSHKIWHQKKNQNISKSFKIYQHLSKKIQNSNYLKLYQSIKIFPYIKKYNDRNLCIKICQNSPNLVTSRQLTKKNNIYQNLSNSIKIYQTLSHSIKIHQNVFKQIICPKNVSEYCGLSQHVLTHSSTLGISNLFKYIKRYTIYTKKNISKHSHNLSQIQNKYENASNTIKSLEHSRYISTQPYRPQHISTYITIKT